MHTFIDAYLNLIFFFFYLCAFIFNFTFQKTLLDFFEIKRSAFRDTPGAGEDKSVALGKGASTPKRSLFNVKKKKKVVKAKRIEFIIAPPSKDKKKRLAQLASIAAAAKAKNMIYMDDLYYPPDKLSRSANNANLDEAKVKGLSKSNLKTFLAFKEMNSRGKYPPIKVVSDDIEGFVVHADDNIPKHSIITEYCGVVESLVRDITR